MMHASTPAAPPVRVPDAPSLVAGVSSAVWCEADGTVVGLRHTDAVDRLHSGSAPIVCHVKSLARRLGTAPFPALDILELFAFVRPARFCLPTGRGVAETLLLTPPSTLEEEATSLRDSVRALLGELRAGAHDDALAVAEAMTRAGWGWGPSVLSAFAGVRDSSAHNSGAGLRVWSRLKEWQETSAPAPPKAWPVEPVEARARLVQLLGPKAEPRDSQTLYASHAAAAFAPSEKVGSPRVVLAEAGTGIGKTLGYIAPAGVWAAKNGGSVWISTFTRNLQRQLDQELDRLYPDLREKARRVVVRKGRENTFCLLNFEEAVARHPLKSQAVVALGLVARWATATRDGDMVGGDFPGWLVDLLGQAVTTDLTDTRGECIYAACAHYRKCFIERQVRKARRAEIVVANHALVMIQAARGGDDTALPTRYVFDEGHHLFDAADSAFSAHLTGRETAELRRWLLGAEDRARSRGRGLRQRLGETIAEDAAAIEAMQKFVAAARALPGPSWRRRLASDSPVGDAETFFALVRDQVRARDPEVRGPYSLECDLRPPIDGLVEVGGSASRMRPVEVASHAPGLRMVELKRAPTSGTQPS